MNEVHRTPRQLFFKNQDETLVGQYRLEGDAPEKIVVALQPSVRSDVAGSELSPGSRCRDD